MLHYAVAMASIEVAGVGTAGSALLRVDLLVVESITSRIVNDTVVVDVHTDLQVVVELVTAWIEQHVVVVVGLLSVTWLLP